MRDIWESGIDMGCVLWRYMTAERFVNLVERSSLYFAAATQFEDPFEGAVAVMPPDFPVDARYEDMDSTENAFRELKRLTKINCWHRADYESDAMWKLYASKSKGVAICSTPERMQAAIQPFRLQPDYGIEDLLGGAVRYKDLLSERLKTSMLKRFFYKHQAFSWEQEFRLAISLRGAEEFAVNVPDLGIEVSVDTSALVEHIILGPALSEAEREQIVQCAGEAGLEDRLAKSSLLGCPRYV